MSVAGVGPKLTRKLSEIAGIEFDYAVGWGDVNWFEGRTADDRHFQVNRRTGEAKPVDLPTHWSSCYPVDPETGHLDLSKYWDGRPRDDAQ